MPVRCFGVIPQPSLNIKLFNRSWLFLDSSLLLSYLDLNLDLGRYAQRRRTFRPERNPDFSRCAMLLTVQISGIPTAT